MNVYLKICITHIKNFYQLTSITNWKGLTVDQIGFEYVTDGVIIFPFCILKAVKGTFRIEYDQRVIIRFLWNERINAHKITHGLQAQFGEHAYTLRTVWFWIAEAWLDRQDLHDEIRTGRPPLDDLDAKILTILDKSPFESANSIADTLGVANSTILLHLHNSIGFRSFHLH
jgi:hypothetical protein